MRTVWITGASRGIGHAIACSLAKDCETFFILSGRQESPALRSLSKDLSRQATPDQIFIL
jgi:short-subunit dehydrogenase